MEVTRLDPRDAPVPKVAEVVPKGPETKSLVEQATQATETKKQHDPQLPIKQPVDLTTMQVTASILMIAPHMDPALARQIATSLTSKPVWDQPQVTKVTPGSHVNTEA